MKSKRLQRTLDARKAKEQGEYQDLGLSQDQNQCQNQGENQSQGPSQSQIPSKSPCQSQRKSETKGQGQGRPRKAKATVTSKIKSLALKSMTPAQKAILAAQNAKKANNGGSSLTKVTARKVVDRVDLSESSSEDSDLELLKAVSQVEDSEVMGSKAKEIVPGSSLTENSAPEMSTVGNSTPGNNVVANTATENSTMVTASKTMPVRSRAQRKSVGKGKGKGKGKGRGKVSGRQARTKQVQRTVELSESDTD